MPPSIIKHDYLGSLTVSLDPALPMEKMVIERGLWEEEVVQLIDWFVRPGSVALDIGANAGLLTLALALQVGETGYVYAFEPDPLAHQRLAHNLSLNPSLKQRLQTYPFGLSDKTDELRVYHADHSGNAYLSQDGHPQYGDQTGIRSHACHVQPLDSLPLRRPVSFMKVDVENMELEVLTGAKSILAADRPVLVYETLLSCFDHEKIRGVEKLLTGLGYVIFVKAPHGKLFATSYPNYAEDTVAIHRSVIPAFGNTFINAALFEVTPEQETACSADLMERVVFWLGAALPQEPFLTLCSPQPQSVGASIGPEAVFLKWDAGAGQVTEMMLKISQGNYDTLSGTYRSSRCEFPIVAKKVEGTIMFL
jgi:FkbM family methyltransferase